VHLLGFIIRIYHDERSSECQIPHYKLRPSSMPMNILRNRAGIFKTPDVLSYKHFSYADLPLFVHFTAQLQSLTTSLVAG
jgi:hypothetical protein